MENQEPFWQLAAESRELFMFISKSGAVTKKTLIEKTGYSRTTLNRVIAPLVECGAVLEIGEDTSSGGRKPTLFDINSKQYYTAGIDITRYAVRIGIFDLRFSEVNYKRSFPMTAQSTPEAVCARIGELFQEGLNALGITRNNIVGAGVSVVASYSRELKMILSPEHFPAQEWKNIPINAMIEAALKVRVYVDHGISIGSQFRYLYLNEQGYENIASIGCGITVHAGVIYKGKLVRSINEGIDAFAHMVINENGEFCKCGNRGCIERYVAAPYIISNYNVLKHQEKQQLETYQAIDQICRLAEDGDPDASQVIKSAACHLSVGLKNLIRLFNIEKVVMNGILMYNGELFFETCKEIVMSDPYTSVKQFTKVNDGQWALTRASAGMAIENFVKGVQ